MNYTLLCFFMLTSCIGFNSKDQQAESKFKTDTVVMIDYKLKELKDNIESNLSTMNFVDQVIESDEVWIVKNSEDIATLESKLKQLPNGTPATLICFWSSKEDALAAGKENWPIDEVTAIPLVVFLQNYLTHMSVDYFYAGLNFSPSRYGTEIDPIDLAIVFCQEIRKKNKTLNFTSFVDIDDYEKKARLSRVQTPKN